MSHYLIIHWSSVMNSISKSNEPSNLDMFMAQVTGTGETDFLGTEHQISLRVNGHIHAQITAIMGIYDMHAREKGRRAPSRNNVLNDLLSIDFEAIYSRLGDDDRQCFDQLFSPACSGALRYVEEEEMEDFKTEMRHQAKKHEAAKNSKASKGDE